MSSAAAVDRGLPAPAPLPRNRRRPDPAARHGEPDPVRRRSRARTGAAHRRASGRRPDLADEPECTVGGLDLLELVAGFDQLIVIDSFKTAADIPATGIASRRTLHDAMNLSNVHDANFATAMELGRRMGMHVPAESDIHIFAVEVQREPDVRRAPQPEAPDAVSGVCEEMLGEIEDLLAADRPTPVTSGGAAAPPSRCENITEPLSRHRPVFSCCHAAQPARRSA